MEKMLTFEEWCKKHGMNQNSALVVAMFHEARIGTIPAENAVVIPPVGEWPDDALAIHFSYASATACYSGMQIISRIPRPKPVWVPQVGEAVFVLRDVRGNVNVGIVTQTGWEEKVEVTIFGNTKQEWIPDVKPFHESHIGKPWDEIPGGVE